MSKKRTEPVFGKTVSRRRRVSVWRCPLVRPTELQSKSGQLVGRYLPELIFALKEIKTKKFVLDGEIVIPVQGSFSFDLCCREFTLLKAGSRTCLKSILRI